MPLDTDSLKNTLLSMSANSDSGKTPEQSIDEFVNALKVFVESATVTVPGNGLVAPSGGGPVTGTSISGSLS